MNIFFMGTPEFAVPTLDILNKNYNVIGIFTQPPRPSGRGMKEIKSSIQQYSEKNKLDFYTPNNLKNDETLKLLKSLNSCCCIWIINSRSHFKNSIIWLHKRSC